MKKIKFILSIFSVVLVLGCYLSLTAFAVDNIDSTEMTKNSSNRKNVVIIDWNDCYEVVIGCEPIVKDDDVLVPLNEFMIITDYRVLSGDGENGITISNGNREITIAANSKNAVVDGTEVVLDKTIYLENDLMYIMI